MPFQRGRAKTGGRKVGVVNRLTGTMREAVQVVYDGMGGHEAFTAWAKKHPTEFYKIASRLIPVEIQKTTDTTINVIIQRDTQRSVSRATVLDAPAVIEHCGNAADMEGM